jgi:hypothetical protein
MYGARSSMNAFGWVTTRLGISGSSLFSLTLVVAGCEAAVESGDVGMDQDNVADGSDDSTDDSAGDSSDSSSDDHAGDDQSVDDQSTDGADDTGGDDTDDSAEDDTAADDSAEDDTGGDDTDDTGGDDTDDGPSGDPDIYEPFTSLSAWDQAPRAPGASIDIVANAAADDDSVAALLFPGNPDLEANDRTSPGFATEIIYPESFNYGKFETRVRFGSCAEGGEEVVNGIFTYFNDGSDQDGDGLPDNSEIDIEQLCGTPELLWLTVYTDYRDFVAGGLKKRTRMVNMRTGSYLEFIDFPPEEGDRGTIEGLSIPSFPASDTFYTIGFEWRADSVRYYIVLNGVEKDLFVLDDPDTVPQRPAQFLMNIWHAPEHWDGSGVGDYPANDSTMLVDWVKIWR